MPLNGTVTGCVQEYGPDSCNLCSCTPTWLDVHALVNDKFYADIYIVQYLKGKLEVLYFGEDTPLRIEIEEFTTELSLNSRLTDKEACALTLS